MRTAGTNHAMTCGVLARAETFIGSQLHRTKYSHSHSHTCTQQKMTNLLLSALVGENRIECECLGRFVSPVIRVFDLNYTSVLHSDCDCLMTILFLFGRQRSDTNYDFNRFAAFRCHTEMLGGLDCFCVNALIWQDL